MSLEDILRDECRRKRLNHLSIVATEGGFSVLYKSTIADVRSAVHRDPVIAIIAAISGHKAAAKIKDEPVNPTAELVDALADTKPTFDNLLD